MPANDVEAFSLGKATRAADGSFDSSNGNVKYVRMHCRTTGNATQARMTQDAELGYTSMAQRIKNGEVIPRQPLLRYSARRRRRKSHP